VGDGKFASGLSIRAAEDLANRWCNSSFGAEILSDDGEVVSGVAVFLDYERNLRRAFPFRVSRKYKGKDGTMRRWPEDRFNDVTVKASLSKALRECILRSLPAGLKAEYERKVREILASKASGNKADAVGRMLQAFTRMGVGKDEIERLRGKDLAAFDSTDITEMGAIYNAIEEGDTTVAQAFGREPAQNGNGGSAIKDALGKKQEAPAAAPEPETEPEAPPPPAPAQAPEAPKKAPKAKKDPEPSDGRPLADLLNDLYALCVQRSGKNFATKDMETLMGCPASEADEAAVRKALAAVRGRK
jgi:hypothetical protein